MTRQQIVTLGSGRQVVLVASEDLKAFLLLFKGRIIASEFSISEGQRYPCSLPDTTQLFVVRSGNRLDVEAESRPVSSSQAGTQQQAASPEGGHGQGRPGSHPAPLTRTNMHRSGSTSNESRELLIIWTIIMGLTTMAIMSWQGAINYRSYLGNEDTFDIRWYLISILLIAVSCIIYVAGLFALFKNIWLGFLLCIVSLAFGVWLLSTFIFSLSFIVASIVVQLGLFAGFAVIHISPKQ